MRPGIARIDQAMQQAVPDQEILFPVVASPRIQRAIETDRVVNHRTWRFLTTDQGFQQVGAA